MEAGRELDALVARALKGWEPEFVEHLKENNGWILIPHYSTDWRSMGVLIEESRKKGLHIDIQTFESHYSAFVFDSGDITKIISTASANEAPYAACLAFVKAAEKSA